MYIPTTNTCIPNDILYLEYKIYNKSTCRIKRQEVRVRHFYYDMIFFSNLFVHLFLINSVKCYQFIIIDNSKISYTGIYVFKKSFQFVTYNLKIHVKIIKKFIYFFFFFWYKKCIFFHEFGLRSSSKSNKSGIAVI